MSTNIVDHAPRPGLAVAARVSPHWLWLAAGFTLSFAVPFLFADVLAIQRDV
mgnify:CR=1 FL=1